MLGAPGFEFVHRHFQQHLAGDVAVAGVAAGVGEALVGVLAALNGVELVGTAAAAGASTQNPPRISAGGP
jgi:hypothetical protein